MDQLVFHLFHGFVAELAQCGLLSLYRITRRSILRWCGVITLSSVMTLWWSNYGHETLCPRPLNLLRVCRDHKGMFLSLFSALDSAEIKSN